jgi:twitching motility protein PilT
LVNSLLTAIVRADGDALVMHVGEQPYVVAASGPVELSSRPLTLEAVAGMLGQLLPADSRRALDELGAIEHQLPKSIAAAGERFTVVAARGGDDIWIEIRRHRAIAVGAAPAAVPAAEIAANVQAPADPAVAPAAAVEATVPAVAPAMPVVPAFFGQAPAVVEAEPPAAVATSAEPPASLLPAPPVEEAATASPVVPQAVAVEPDPDELDVPFDFDDGSELVFSEPPAATPPPPVFAAPPVVPAARAAAPDPLPAVVPLVPANPIVVAPPLTAVSRPVLAPPAPPQERYIAPRPTPSPAARPERFPESAAPVLPSPALERFAAIRAARPVERPADPAPTPMNDYQDQAPPQAEPSQAVVLPLARNPVRPDTTPSRPMPPPRIAGLDRLLRLAAARGATTIYLMSGGRPSIRVDGEIVPLDGEPDLTASEVESLLLDMAPERNREALRNGEGTEWMSDVAEVGRFRCQSFRDHRGPGGIFRMISTRPTSVEQLGLSREIQALCAETEGLLLVAGPRSSGKSTLISAFVDLINRTRHDYVITIESQIACTHDSRGCLVSQREVRGNGEEMAAAVRAALRENPDVLVIEDMRSPKVVALALEAMEKGHLVVGAISAHTATTAIGRILDQCQPERREQVQLMLAEGLRGVVSQVLLKKAGGGRVAAREVLLNTSAIASLIAEGRISQLPLALDSGRKYGMVPLNDALAGFVQSGVVDVKDAYRQAFERQAFLAVLRREGVDTSFVERLA